MRRVLILLLLVPLLISCGMDPNLNGGNDTVYEDSADWMGRLPSGTLIRNITMPGTHDSCANYDYLGLSSISSTQDLTLMEQLEAGVRCLDIRITEKDGVYGVYHGPVYMKMTLDDVAKVCKDFLGKHPTEFILMFVQYENGHYRLGTGAIAALRDSDTDLFYQGEDLLGVTLSEVAGTIIVAENYWHRYDEPALVSEDDFWVPDDEWGYDEEEFWVTEDPQIILDNALTLMEMVRTNNRNRTDYPASYSTSSYFSGQFGLPNYRIVSSFVNPRIQAEIGKYAGTGTYFGILRVDHITRDLAHAIYSCNSLL
jgi:1-phosphatidylinositol phosphodiesterase